MLVAISDLVTWKVLSVILIQRNLKLFICCTSKKKPPKKPGVSVFASFLQKSKITCLFFSLQCAVDCSLATTPQDCSCPPDMNKKNTCTSTPKEGQVLARQQANNKRKKINCLNTAELRFFLLIAPGNLWRFYHTCSFLEKKFQFHYWMWSSNQQHSQRLYLLSRCVKTGDSGANCWGSMWTGLLSFMKNQPLKIHHQNWAESAVTSSSLTSSKECWRFLTCRAFVCKFKINWMHLCVIHGH